jgi:integrase
MLTHAVDRGVIPLVPLRIKGAGNVKPEREPQTANESQLAALLGAVPDVDRAGVLIAAWCGLRVGEVVGLQRADIVVDPRCPVPDEPEVRVWVRRHVVQNRGRKPGEPALLIVRRDKTQQRDGIVIPPHILPDVYAHLAEHTPGRADAWLFPSRTDPAAPLHPSTLDNAWQRAKKSVGLPHFTYHDLRRTANTVAAESGATLGEMMQRLRHSTISAAQRYIVAAQGADRRLAQRMSERATRSARPQPRPVTPAADPAATAGGTADMEVERRVAERLRELGVDPSE